jgi:hypothetical protein
VATEAGRQSTVPVEVWLQDVNDNAPQFVQPLYTASVREDLQLGETILTGLSYLIHLPFSTPINQ